MLPMLDIIRKKILDPEKLDHTLGLWRFQGKKIVFTNGCFDLLHLGHIDYLSKASDEGDILFIGLNSNASTARLKGPNRPITKEGARAMILASLHFVDAVVLFNEETPYDLIRKVQPDVLVKGSDYKEENIVGFDIVKDKGGIVKTTEGTARYSGWR